MGSEVAELNPFASEILKYSEIEKQLSFYAVQSGLTRGKLRTV